MQAVAVVKVKSEHLYYKLKLNVESRDCTTSFRRNLRCAAILSELYSNVHLS
jgi:hypothetical protein